jgi:hypothetical protein
MRELHMSNGDVEDATRERQKGDVVYAPMILLDCKECAGFTGFNQESATQAVCRECTTVQSNERIVDLNGERV